MGGVLGRGARAQELDTLAGVVCICLERDAWR